MMTFAGFLQAVFGVNVASEYNKPDMPLAQLRKAIHDSRNETMKAISAGNHASVAADRSTIKIEKNIRRQEAATPNVVAFLERLNELDKPKGSE